MIFVDHDPTAARLAALRCRTAADELRRMAGWLERGPAAVAWSGPARDAVVEESGRIADALRREAAALEDSADRLEVAAQHAEHADAAALARHRERLRAAARCAPTGVAVGAR